MKPIRINSSKNPIVSIVIPVYGQLPYVLKCLESISNAKENTPIEVIVMDDNSPEKEVEKVLSKIEGIKYIKNSENLRFVKNVNKGASLSKGEYIFFLNSDTLVTDYYLETLLSTYTKFENVFSVGSKLVYPNGQLQEAGSILHTDATGINYGAFDDPYSYKYNFVREVHYCSAAALLVKKDIFEKLGRFDEDFSPGYYDDSELQMRAKQKGYLTLYQPKSIVVHFEGMTHGKDPEKFSSFFFKLSQVRSKFLQKKKTANIKEYQLINKEKMYQKHKELLEQKCFTSATELDRKVYQKDKPQLFFLEDNLPDFDKSSGSLRLLNLLKILQKEFNVTLLTRNISFNSKYLEELSQNGIRTLIDPLNRKHEDVYSFLEKNLEQAEVVVMARPEVTAFFYKFITKLINQRQLKTTVVYDTVDLHFRRLNAQKELIEDDSETKKYFEKITEYSRALETLFITTSDEVWVVSEDEREYLIKNKFSTRVRVIPNIWDPQVTKTKYTHRKDLLFIGTFGHDPNVDAIEFYVDEIIPILKKEKIQIKLNVIGSRSEFLPKRIIESDYLKIWGYVEDPTELFEKSLIAFYPLRFGAGMKGKVTHALALGLPIVTTDIGAQGHKGASDFMCLGNTAQELVDGVKKYLNNEKTWTQNRLKGLQFLKENFSSNAVHEKIKKFKQDIY